MHVAVGVVSLRTTRHEKCGRRPRDVFCMSVVVSLVRYIWNFHVGVLPMKFPFLEFSYWRIANVVSVLEFSCWRIAYEVSAGLFAKTSADNSDAFACDSPDCRKPVEAVWIVASHAQEVG